MARENVAKRLDITRWNDQYPDIPVERRTNARSLYRTDPTYQVTGQHIREVYGQLYYYTSQSIFDRYISMAGSIGRTGWDGGAFLTPTLYVADIAPYNLGLRTPVSLCIVIRLPDNWELWGPATSNHHPKCRWPDVWEGGAIEFYSPRPIPLDYASDPFDLEPRGDRHRLRGTLSS